MTLTEATGERVPWRLYELDKDATITTSTAPVIPAPVSTETVTPLNASAESTASYLLVAVLPSAFKTLHAKTLFEITRGLLVTFSLAAKAIELTALTYSTATSVFLTGSVMEARLRAAFPANYPALLNSVSVVAALTVFANDFKEPVTTAGSLETTFAVTTAVKSARTGAALLAKSVIYVVVSGVPVAPLPEGYGTTSV